MCIDTRNIYDPVFSDESSFIVSSVVFETSSRDDGRVSSTKSELGELFE